MAEISKEQDGILLQQVRDGDEAAFNTLYDRYWNFVFFSAMKRLKDEARAKDISQDIFTTLWLKRETLRIDNLHTYLYTAVKNRVLNLFEKERRFIPFEELLNRNIECHGERADAVALRHEFLRVYTRLIDSLPPQRQKIFRYYYDQCLSTEEISRELSLSRKTVQNQLTHAVTYVRANLATVVMVIALAGYLD